MPSSAEVQQYRSQIVTLTDAAAADLAAAEGLNTIGGRLAHPGVIEAFPDLPAVSPQED